MQQDQINCSHWLSWTIKSTIVHLTVAVCTYIDSSQKEDFALVSDPSTSKRDTQASFLMFLLLQFVIDKMWVTTGLCNRIPGESEWLEHS